jgi:hypothetical protein
MGKLTGVKLKKKSKKLINKKRISKKNINRQNINKTYKKGENIYRRNKKYTQRGGIDIKEIKISAGPALNIASNTISAFLKSIFESPDDYDNERLSKYNFGTYDNMIKCLSVLNMNLGEGTILNKLLLDINNTDDEHAENLDIDKLPEIIKIILNLKVSSCNLAYFFTKNPSKNFFKSPIYNFFPENIKQYLNFNEKENENYVLETILENIFVPMFTLTRKPDVKYSPHQTRNIIDKIKEFIMKSDYKQNQNNDNGWHITNVLLELLVNLIVNLDLKNNDSPPIEEYKSYIKKLNDENIIKCNLIDYLMDDRNNYLKIDKEKDIFGNLFKLYEDIGGIKEDYSVGGGGSGKSTRRYNKQSKQQENDDIRNYSIKDFFNKKNTNGYLPPIILFVLSCSINTNVDVWNEMLKNIGYKCDDNKSPTTKPSLFSRVKSRITGRRPQNTAAPVIPESSIEEEEIFYTPRNSSSIHSGGDDNDIKTSCSPNDPSILDGQIDKLTNILKGIIFSPICEDLKDTSKKMDWNSFRGINTIRGKINSYIGNILFPEQFVIKKIVKALAPYNTFFPLNANEYIGSFFTKKYIKNKPLFDIFVENVETKLIQNYKENESYTDPLCVPLTILNNIDEKKTLDSIQGSEYV